MTDILDHDQLVPRFQRMMPRMLDELRQLVELESPSTDREALSRSAQLVARIGQDHLGSAPEVILIDACPHLRWQWGSGPGILVLGHHDTVWPLGSLSSHPWSLRNDPEGQTARGPGCFDMLAGLVQMFHAIGALPQQSAVTVLITADEEIGSPTSRELIEHEARRSRAALVLEASGPGGALKLQRKGASLYDIHVEGRAAHAGLEPERGVNAALEIALHTLAVARLGDAEAETTVTPTTLVAGTTTNTVPARAQVSVDVRAWTRAEQERVDSAVRARTPNLPGAIVRVEGGINRPPLELNQSEELFAVARHLGGRLGLELLQGVSVGGASDGNFTAGVGTPTLDGLGAVGGGAHADDEHVLVDQMPPRAALLAALVDALLRDPRPEGAP